MIAKEYARYLTGVSAVLGLAVMAAAAFSDDDDERDIISFDPRSSDFLKVRFGDTRMDLMSGLIQPSVFLTRMLMGQRLTSSGHTVALRNWFRVNTDDFTADEYVRYGRDSGPSASTF